MSPWFLIPFCALIATAQATLLPLVTIAGYRVDLGLLVVVAWGLVSRPGEAAAWGLATGLFLDLASGLPFGTQALALTLVGLLMGLIQMMIFRDNILLPPTAAFIATWVYNLLVLGLLSLLGWPMDWNEYLLRITLPTAILNTAVLPLAYFPLLRLHRRWHPQVEW
jgi:rod shape-determining protein MreD